MLGATIAAWISASLSSKSAKNSEVVASVASKQLEQTERNVEMMQRNLEIIQKESTLRTRPYLARSYSVDGEIWIENFGEIPAAKVKCRKFYRFEWKTGKGEVKEQWLRASHGGSEAYICPRGKSWYGQIIFADSVVQEVIQEGCRVEFYFLVDYWSYDGTKHFEEITASYFDPLSSKNKIWKKGDQLNVLTLWEGPLEICPFGYKKEFVIENTKIPELSGYDFNIILTDLKKQKIDKTINNL